MFVNRCFDTSDMNNMNTMNNTNAGMESSMNMGMNQCCPAPSCPQVMECPQERVCHRQICYDVPHIVPINTRIINHHIYRHTYQPVFTCCEENEVCNVYDNKCGF